MSPSRSEVSGQGVDQWLATLGLRFDPFRRLNADYDDRIHEYLVGHETFEAIRGNDVSFVFAPAGGGKSAFRVRLARACRVGEQGRRIFPIVYLLPGTVILAKKEHLLQVHLRAIFRAAAFELLLRLAYRPHEFTALDGSTQQTIRVLLEQGLPSPLPHILAQMETPDDLSRLAQSYDPTARWPNAPNAKMLREFRQNILGIPLPPELPAPSDDLNRWLILWLDLLLGPMGFEAVYLLLDGVDAYPETLRDGRYTIAVLSPLLKQAAKWAKRLMFLKAFLPLELEPELRKSFPELLSRASVGIVKWTPELLVALLRSRVEAATETAPASLDMLCHPGLRGADELVIRAVKPLPREVLAFVERMLFEHVRRFRAEGKLTREDLEADHRWYTRNGTVTGNT